MNAQILLHQLATQLGETIAAAEGHLEIGLRVDGSTTDNNLFVRYEGMHEELWVTADGAQRASTQLVAEAIQRAIAETSFRPDVREVYDRATCATSRGWVVLVLERGYPQAIRFE